ncbi:hypothetical protein [Marimonas arenosa]|uniref:Uncharacterized protein n=1 Tax=Marimonas arenosa TaxID=1795305 RepID=A0AAE4B582_9RHOB|nr:hypothetical protein [Marimonas arenosa]MDQ2088986.1 hypothetical protein [Marimonas arenosa]
MNRRFAISAGLGLLLAFSGFGTPAFTEESGRKGYLRAVYSWRIPALPNCGTSEPFSTEVPFVIEGNRIKGLYDIEDVKDQPPRVLPLPEDPTDPWLEDVFAMPETPSQEIDYSYTCGACKVSGSIVIHKLRGKVVILAGEPSLRFSLTYSNPLCKVDCGSYGFNCRDTEKVIDMFVTPVEDGYVVDRPQNMIFKYLVRLE